MELEGFYEFVVTVIPDGAMVMITFIALLFCIRRYKVRGQMSIFTLAMPIFTFFLFYVWGIIFSPDSLARLALGRIVSFMLMVGIILWASLTTNDEDERS